jgi:hypothetical protein
MDGTTTTTNGGAGDEQVAPDAPTTDQPQLLATAVGDTCANCGARLAGDQRYCVECGERRGKSRYSLPGASGSTRATAASSRPPRRTLSGNSALLGGIAVLLIAMGVGVLIGRTSNGTSPRNPPVQVNLGAQGTGGAAAATTPTTTSSTPTTRHTSSSSTPKKVTAKNAAASLAAKLPAKAKVIPKALKSKVAPKIGSKCAGGGTYSGTFFGSSGTNSSGCSK